MTTPSSRTEDPVSLADALNTFRAAGMLFDEPRSPGSRSATDRPEPSGSWSDGPGRVLERTDALDLSAVAWDGPAVFAAVWRVAELAHIPCSQIRIVDDPSEFPVDQDAEADLRHDECAGTPLRRGWVRKFGVLADRRSTNRLRDWIGANRQQTDSPRVGPGHVLRTYCAAERWVESEALVDTLLLSSVAKLVEAYTGFMIDNGAAGWEHHWQPREGVLDEFGIELRIGRLLTDAFCAGLGYLAVVDTEIVVARRPALRLLDTAAVDGLPRFHHDAGPAVEFADGTGLHFLEGIYFQPWLHRAIVDGALTMRYVRDMPSWEGRVAAYPSMPPAALLDGLHARLLDVGRKGTRLYRIDDLPDHEDPVWYIVMTDPSTGRDYGEFVPPEIGVHRSADAAQAAAWGISVADYRRIALEG